MLYAKTGLQFCSRLLLVTWTDMGLDGEAKSEGQILPHKDSLVGEGAVVPWLALGGPLSPLGPQWAAGRRLAPCKKRKIGVEVFAYLQGLCCAVLCCGRRAGEVAIRIPDMAFFSPGD